MSNFYDFMKNICKQSSTTSNDDNNETTSNDDIEDDNNNDNEDKDDNNNETDETTSKKTKLKNKKIIVIPYPLEYIYKFKPELENNNILIYDCTDELKQIESEVIFEKYASDPLTFFNKDMLIEHVSKLFSTRHVDLLNKYDIFCFTSDTLYGCNIIKNATMVALYYPFSYVEQVYRNVKYFKNKSLFTYLVMQSIKMVNYDKDSSLMWDSRQVFYLKPCFFNTVKDMQELEILCKLYIFKSERSALGSGEIPIVPNLHSKFDAIININEKFENNIIKLINS